MIIPVTPPPVQTLTSFTPFLTQLQPLLTHRVTTPTPPPSLSPETVSYLCSLSDHQLSEIEADGPINFFTHPSTSPPAYLRHLALRAAALSSSFPLLNSQPAPASPVSRRRSRARPHAAKRFQIQSITHLLSHITQSHPNPHILDIGAGHAHLAAHLASSLDIPVTALDNNPHLIQTAYQLHTHPNLSVTNADINSAPPPIAPHHLLVGLHACGALGDTLIRLSAHYLPAAALLVSCCLQKIPTQQPFRQPLSHAAATNTQLRAFLTLPRQILGATNRPCASPSPQQIQARVTRHALRTLLRDRQVPVTPGHEVHGVSRHALKRGLSHVAPAVLEIHGLSPHISEHEARHRMHLAQQEYRVMRALSVPRVLAGHVLEMAIVLDRAAALQEAGYTHVLTCRPWPHNISPRNLCCAAWL